jgi:predicted RND superfamily exporter protein
MEVVVRFDERACRLNMLQRMEIVQRVQARVESLPQVGSALSALTFAPPLPGGKGYSLRRSVTNRKLEENRHALVEGGYLKKSGREELWRISARVPALDYGMDYGRFVHEIQAAVDPVLKEERSRGATGVLPAVYTGLVPLIYKAQNSLLDGLVWGFVGDWLLVAVVMMLVVRAWSAGVLLMVPSVFPAVVVFGVMGWLGILVDTGTVMTPAVALGVTVDDVVHFMLWYRSGLLQGLDRRQSILLAYKGCARAMYQSWGVIGLGLAVFALSPFMPTQRFGYMMVALLSASLVGNLVVLPALLASPFGAIFSWRIERQRQVRLREVVVADRRGAAAIDLPLPSSAAPAEHRSKAA